MKPKMQLIDKQKNSQKQTNRIMSFLTNEMHQFGSFYLHLERQNSSGRSGYTI